MRRQPAGGSHNGGEIPIERRFIPAEKACYRDMAEVWWMAWLVTDAQLSLSSLSKEPPEFLICYHFPL